MGWVVRVGVVEGPLLHLRLAPQLQLQPFGHALSHLSRPPRPSHGEPARTRFPGEREEPQRERRRRCGQRGGCRRRPRSCCTSRPKEQGGEAEGRLLQPVVVERSSPRCKGSAPRLIARTRSGCSKKSSGAGRSAAGTSGRHGGGGEREVSLSPLLLPPFLERKTSQLSKRRRRCLAPGCHPFPGDAASPGAPRPAGGRGGRFLGIRRGRGLQPSSPPSRINLQQPNRSAPKPAPLPLLSRRPSPLPLPRAEGRSSAGRRGHRAPTRRLNPAGSSCLSRPGPSLLASHVRRRS